jgi:Chaperone of endosialidase
MRQKFARVSVFAISVLLCSLFSASAALGQNTSFTYQGRLADGSTPAAGIYDMKFRLYDAGGNAQGTPDTVTLDNPGVQVTNGVFAVQLDFGADAFTGGPRLLEISVRPHSADPQSPAYTTLSPRQPITSTPYAVRSLTAATADSATSSTTAANFSGSLSGDVTGAQSATVVTSVGGQSAASVAGATEAVSGASSANAPNVLVRRDASGDFSAGTISANLNGNATSATTATNFSGSLAGDVTGSQSATVVSAVGGQSASSVAGATTAINAATSANTASTVVKRDASGNFSAGTITASLNGNADSATTATGVSASAGTSVVAAVNASSSSINTANVSGDVELAPAAQQTTSSTNSLINLKLIGSQRLGQPGVNSLLSLSASGSYPDDQTYDKERFRVDNDGSILSVADYSGGINTTAPAEGAGTRFMWYGTKAALRAGQINGTQWDDANIGLYSTAFGENVRALGDNALAIGKNSVAAGSRTVAIGERNTATGYASIALGYGASTSTSAGSPRNGTFVFSDFSNSACDFNNISNDCQFHPSVTNSFNVRAVNGSYFYTSLNLSTSFIFNSTTATMTLSNSKLSMKSDGSTELTSNSGGTAGVSLAAGGGSWSSLSDRNMKANFATVNPREILRGVLALPISTWNYKSQDSAVRHIGPMAQDFFATFRVGESDKTIATIDPDGVALAAIQGLHEELKDRDAKIDWLHQQVRQQQEQIDLLKKMLCLDHPNATVCKESK